MVRLSIYNAIGQEIRKLVNQEIGVGSYSVDFNATELPNGIYFYKIQAGDFTQTKKMILLK
ncbi:MAG: T9SS type A sorting domain-containing protein [Ignavibacteriales bacterium]|nr:T9SS type A sorting domain-containing protein [Ignavibacteriales bacterium]